MGPIFAVYYCLTFWMLCITEAVLDRRGIKIPSRFPAEDRFLGYLFVAPIIWPWRMYKLLRLAAQRG